MFIPGNFRAAFNAAPLAAVLAACWVGSGALSAARAQLPNAPSAALSQDPDAACATCHRQIFDSWRRTPMAHASGPAAEGFMPADFIHPASGVSYRLYLDQGQVWLSYERPNAPPNRALKGRQQLSFYVGSGRRGRTWLFEREGYWYEVPINWYAKQHLWDMAPGFGTASEMPLTLMVDSGCLHCHASGVQSSLPDARNHFSGPPFLHGGITCESCHGDSARHLTTGGKQPILNPAKLDPVRRVSICLQCHLEGEVAVVKQGRSLNAFRPGDNLFDNVVFFEDGRKAGPAGRATSQWESLLESACKRASGDRLTCTTCHDPHTSVAAEDRVSSYRTRCLACHRALTSGHYDQTPDCTSCHMPQERTQNIAHEQVTDHRIQIVAKPFAIAPGAQELVAIGGIQPAPRDEGIAWAELAMHGDRSAGERAMSLLLQAEASDPNQVSDTQLHIDLGFLEQVSGKNEQAMRDYQEALRADPFNETAAGDLGVLDAQQGNYTAALPLWETAFRHDPGASAAGVDLALVQCRLGQASATMQTLQRVLLFSPDNDTARKISLAMAAGTQKCGSR